MCDIHSPLRGDVQLITVVDGDNQPIGTVFAVDSVDPEDGNRHKNNPPTAAKNLDSELGFFGASWAYKEGSLGSECRFV